MVVMMDPDDEEFQARLGQESRLTWHWYIGNNPSRGGHCKFCGKFMPKIQDRKERCPKRNGRLTGLTPEEELLSAIFGERKDDDG